MTAAAQLSHDSDGERVPSALNDAIAECERRLTLLVIEPETAVAEQIVLDFLNHRIDTHVCKDGAEALIALGRHQVDAVLAAASVPILSGPHLVEAIRRHSPQLPILIGAGQADTEAAVGALAAGANAAVARPYRSPEVVPLLRATFPEAAIGDLPDVIELGPLRLDAGSRQVVHNGEPLVLPPREFDLLCYLMVNADRVVTSSQIMDHVWGLGSQDTSNTLSVHMRRIRLRLCDDPRNPRIILSVHGVGYRLVLPYIS